MVEGRCSSRPKTKERTMENLIEALPIIAGAAVLFLLFCLAVAAIEDERYKRRRKRR